MDRVFTAIKDRYNNLTSESIVLDVRDLLSRLRILAALFRDQKLELDTEFEKYACGLVSSSVQCKGLVKLAEC